MAANDKTLKFSVGLDDPSVRKAISGLRELTSELNKLADATKRAMTGVSGMQFSTKSSGSFKVGSEAITSGTRGAGGGIAGILTQGLTADKNFFKTIASASKEALDAMKNNLKNSVSEQSRAIDELTRKMQGLGERYKYIESIGKLTPKTAETMEAGIGGYAAQLGGARGVMARQQAALGAAVAAGGPPTIPPVAGGGVGGTPPAGGGAVGGGALSAMIGGYLQARSAIAAAKGGYDFIVNPAIANRIANLNEILQRPYDKYDVGARIGGSIGQVGMQIRGGDIALSWGLRKVQRDREVALSLAQNRLARNELAEMTVGGQTVRSGDVLRAGGQGMGAWTAENIGTGGASDTIVSGVGTATERSLALRRARLNITADAVERDMDAARKAVAADPFRAYIFNQAWTGAEGRLAVQRATGVGGGRGRETYRGARRLSQILSENYGTTGSMAAGTWRSADIDLEAAANRAGFDIGAVASMNQQLAAVAGRRLMGGGLGLLGMQTGGLSNVAKLYGVGAQFSGGGAAVGGRAFLNAIQGAGIGRGGVDITAGAQIADLVSAGMMTGNFSGTGISAMQGMMAAGYTGAPGGDMRAARMMGAGLSVLGQNMAGGTDPLQRGINVLAANRAAPGAGHYARQALMGIEPMQLIDILRGKDFPRYLADQGVTLPMIQAYVGTRGKFQFSRYISEAGAGTAVGAAVARARAAGGAAGDIRGLLGGVGARSRDGQSIINREIGLLALGMPGENREANIMALRAELAGTAPDLFPTLITKGAHDPTDPTSIARTKLRADAKRKVADEAAMLKDATTIKDLMSTSVDDSQAINEVVGNLKEGAVDFDKALTALTQSMMKNLAILAPREATRIEKERKAAAQKGSGG